MTKQQKYFRRVLAGAGLSQTEFARRIGFTQGLIGQWIRGERPISLDAALLIEEEFGADAGRLSSDVERARRAILVKREKAA